MATELELLRSFTLQEEDIEEEEDLDDDDGIDEGSDDSDDDDDADEEDELGEGMHYEDQLVEAEESEDSYE